MVKEETIILVGVDIFENVKEYFSKFPDATIFSLNYSSHVMLSKEGINHKIGDELLSDSDFSLIDNFTNDLSSNWFLNDKIHNKIKFETINLGSLLQSEFHRYFIEYVIEIIQIKKILEHKEHLNIISFTKINHYISQICKTKNFNSSLIESKQSIQLPFDNLEIKSDFVKLPISIKISRKNYLKIKTILEKLLIKFSTKNFHQNKKSILFFEFNIQNYEDLLNSFSNSNQNILLLNTRRPTIWNFKTFKIIRKNKCHVINLQNYKKLISLQMSSESDKLIEKLEDLWKNDSLFENLFSLKGFTFWPDLKNSFTKICNERFLESVSRILLFKEFLSSSNISTILLWSEPSQEEQELISLAKTKKINLVYLQHAMAAIEDAFYPAGKLISHLGHNSQCDKHAVWGEPAKQYALSYDSKKQIFVTGSPRHDNFFNNKNSLNQENYILFATTRPNPLFSKTRTTNSISAFSNFIVETCRVFSNLPEKKLVIKPHPSPVSNLDVMTLAKKIDSNISFTYDSDVMKIIEKCEFLITTNNSTIALEAMMLNKPVISLQTESLALTENIAKSNAIISVSNIDDIEIAIKKLIYDKDFKNQLLKNAKIFLDEFFSYQGKSSKNFIHQIELE